MTLIDQGGIEHLLNRQRLQKKIGSMDGLSIEMYREKTQKSR